MGQPFLLTSDAGVDFDAEAMVRRHARHAIPTPGSDGMLHLPGVCDREASHR